MPHDVTITLSNLEIHDLYDSLDDRIERLFDQDAQLGGDTELKQTLTDLVTLRDRIELYIYEP